MRTSPLSLSLFILAVAVTTGAFVVGSDPLQMSYDAPTKVAINRKANLTSGTVLGESAFATETKIFTVEKKHFSKQPNGFTIIQPNEHFLIGEVSPITKKLMGTRAMSLFTFDAAALSPQKSIEAYAYSSIHDRWARIPVMIDFSSGSAIAFHKPGRSHIAFVEVQEQQGSHFSFGIQRILQKSVKEAVAKGDAMPLSI